MEIKKIHDLPAGPAIQDEFELPASIGTGPTDVKRFTFAALKVWILAFVGPYISGITIGPTGLTGATGATGGKGDKGDKGDPGPEGPRGPRGESGPAQDLTDILRRLDALEARPQ